MLYDSIYREALLFCLAGLIAQQTLSRIHHVSTIKVLLSYTLGNGSLLIYIPAYKHQIPRLLLLNTVFLTTLLSLTAVRRLFLHPLSGFPGQKRATLSSFYQAYEDYRGAHGRKLQWLHGKHGDFVRTGPDDLSINNVEAIAAVMGRKQPTDRGPLYGVGQAMGSYNLITCPDKELHAKWRRIWDNGFRGKNLELYNPRVEHHVNRMVSNISRLAGKEANIVGIINNMTFDLTMDLTFAKDTDLQGATGDRRYIDFLHAHSALLVAISSLRSLGQLTAPSAFIKALENLGLCGQVTWLRIPGELLAYVPLFGATKAFQALSKQMVEDRQKLGKSRQDIFTVLLGEDDETGSKFTTAQLIANGNLAINAGADTSSSVMACTLRMLALNPEIQQKLYDALETDFVSLQDITVASVKNHRYLNGVINEGLRSNPVPSGPQVITQESLTIAGTHIPKHTTIRIPHILLLADERYFERGQEFIPERWTDQPELVLDRRAFIPFSYGPHACVGKHLALGTLRLSLAKIVRGFKVELGESYDDAKFYEGWKDHFTVMLGPFPLKFMPRTA